MTISGNRRYRNFFKKQSDFPGKQQKLASFIFTVLQKQIKIKWLFSSREAVVFEWLIKPSNLCVAIAAL